MSALWEGSTPTDTPDIWENVNGFWFIDETFDFNGPYTNKQDAIIALGKYVAWLNAGTPVKAVNGTSNLPQSTVKYYGD